VFGGGLRRTGNGNGGFNNQLSVVSCQLSVVSCQLSVVSCQLSVVSYERSAKTTAFSGTAEAMPFRMAFFSTP
jgi:hypothetical protein